MEQRRLRLLSGGGEGYQRKPWLILTASAPKPCLQKLTICQSTLPDQDQ